ncbi:MAG: poly-beta-hydroxybutyrate polymerase [Alphaproteobacteria bacterium CG_4_9_14_3_um_filter_47_13]|nr:MAG: poly-beta-hydroxybutyrate polymerase [Alphaproteobacteria bacterium CG_4_9_14_3_um_filter_47_13]
MTKVVTLKPPHGAVGKKSAAALPERLRSAHECPAYQQPSDEYHLDHIWHGELAKFTGGISPIALGLAGFDWWAHLMFSPAKQQALWQSYWGKKTLINQYAAKAALGAEVEPVIEAQPADQRFSSENWKNWPFNIMAQGFLLRQEWWNEATTGVRGVSEHHLNVASYMARQVLDIISPSNSPLTNPDIIQTTKEQGGRNFMQGMLNFLDDTERAKDDKPPAGAEVFEVGKNIAATKGKVVYRNKLIELIQYEPTTAEVYAEPILITPAWIMKYYILDLSPENSLVKYLVDKGHTVFMISWKNPDTCDRDIGLEDYLHLGIGEALKAVKSITKAPQIHGVGYCLGGTLLSIMAAAHARDGDDSFKTISLLASQVDFEEAGEIMLFVDDSQVAFLEDVMWNQGYLDKGQMAGAFEMLRPNDLIWSRMITEYMQGKRAPVYDMLAWNADATRMPYRMHSEYLRSLFLQNDLAEGRFIVNDAPVALQDIRTPLFSVGTSRDHIAPWKSVYKILLLTESQITFVLTSGGHNAGIVSEPGHKGRTYQMATVPNTAHYKPPGQWKTTTPITEGSWWDAWEPWLVEHGDEKTVPPSMGDTKDYTPIRDAPGKYVLMV